MTAVGASVFWRDKNATCDVIINQTVITHLSVLTIAKAAECEVVAECVDDVNE